MTEVQGIVKVEEETIKIENVNTKETATLKKIKSSIQIQQSNNIENVNEEEEEKENKEKENLRKEEYIKNVKIAEDTCEKCPLRCLVFIPICFGYSLLSIFDLITYLITPLFYCLFYSISFICTSCLNVISSYQVEEEIAFSGAFTSENEIQLHISNEGGVLHLREIVCFSYMSTCIKRYFCFIFVLINHIYVPIKYGWKKAKSCFLKSKIEELYEERVKNAEDMSSYKGFKENSPKIEIINI
jgi:hypothetical protein